MKFLLLFLLLLALLGLAYEAWMRRRDGRKWPAPGKLVDVGGHRLHVRQFGEGGEVVVFEAGEGEWSTHWGRLPEELAQETLVVAYDRGGLGWSDPGPPPRDVETIARELHQLLTRVAPGRKAILVGHGTGAHVQRVYAHRYPFETAGLVFVDGYHEGLDDRLRREQIPTPATPGWVQSISGLAARFGLLRLLFRRHSPNGHLPLAPRQQALLDALELDPRVRRAAMDELEALPRTLTDVARANDDFELPVRVLVSSRTLGPEDVPGDFPRAEYNRIWVEQSEALLELSTRSERVLVEDSDHLVQLRRPELVLGAIRDVLSEARRPVDDDASAEPEKAPGGVAPAEDGGNRGTASQPMG